jgi:hypothetical protein
MPKPGKEPLKRLRVLKGPEYLQASLFCVSVLLLLELLAVLSSPDVRSSPRVAGGLASGRSELLRVEAGEVGSGSHCDVCGVSGCATGSMCGS